MLNCSNILLLEIKKHSKPLIYMGFPYYQESTALLFKIKYLENVIHKFVLITSNITFLGYPQSPYNFEPYVSELQPYFDEKRIFIYKTNLNNFSLCMEKYHYDNPKSKIIWRRECVMRNSIILGLIAAGIKPGNFFFVGDADEFPTLECVNFLIKYPPSNFINIYHNGTFRFTFKFKFAYSAAKYAYVKFPYNDLSINKIRFANKVFQNPSIRCLHLHNAYTSFEQFIHKYKDSYSHRDDFSDNVDKIPFCNVYTSLFLNVPINQEIPNFPTYMIQDPKFSFLFESVPFPLSFKKLLKCPQISSQKHVLDLIRNITISNITNGQKGQKVQNL